MRLLGEKIIVVATLTLLLCMLLYSLFSWSLFRLSEEREASDNAQVHLLHFKQAYQIHTTNLIHVLEQVTLDRSVTSTISYPYTQATQESLQNQLTTVLIRYHLSWLAIVSNNYHIQLQMGNMDESNTSIATEMVPFIKQALQGHAVTTLQKNIAPVIDPSVQGDQWALSIAVPIRDSVGILTGALLVAQPIDNYFAQELAQQVGTNVLLCLSEQIQGTSGPSLNAPATEVRQKICTQAGTQTVNGAQQYLTLTGLAKTKEQMANSPDLEIVAVELLANSNHLFLIIAGVSIFVFALEVIISSFLMRKFFITPLRRLQAHIHAQLTDNTGTQVALPHGDEIEMLSLSFKLLSDSLESENQALTEQMTNILLISDTLISTLNLEHLLGEIVSRLGHIMQVTHVSLLLYGRETLLPWAVAQWEKDTDTQVDSHATPPPNTHHSLQEQGDITVHVDPDGDITMAVTTKMATIPRSQANDKHSGAGTSKKPASSASGDHRSRIPPQARRDLDMILARIAIQKQKIAHAEDIAMIYEERKDNWARMALDAGYCSATAVPLLLRDQAIGAFILYTDKPHPISNTFLLSTVAMQASMAIQNAQLFAEVKEKNAALERASRLKAQFLANVTHELRTPLHSIISHGSFILEGFGDGELTAEQERDIQLMVGCAENLSHLVNDMLDLSKIEADRIEIRLEPLDLRSCLMEVVNQLKPIAKDKELYLNLEMEEGLPMVMADGHHIRQVATNLVSNALKFTEKGGVTIRCTPVRKGKMLHISVNDTGIGISPATFGYIFEAFRQADGSTTRRFGGTGLGLTIARKLVELQGSEVAVESVPGQGSTFSFTLPVVSSTNEI